ncbi:MAG: class I fructose-bisphosphate aldolase [Pseudomonadota bacterium]
MHISNNVKKILERYESDSPGTKVNLARILTHGKMANTGKLIIFPVDQGFEHGPRAFTANSAGYDPHYHYQLAVDAGVSAFAAPLGLLEAGASTYAGQVPTILKINSSNGLSVKQDQALTATIAEALRLGCSAIGITIYPGAQESLEMFEEAKELAAEAKSCGLAVIIWSYPRGPNISSAGETALNVVAYSAHMAALLGAHIIKVKFPTSYVEDNETAPFYRDIPAEQPQDRIKHIVQSCFAGRRLVVFSGGTKKDNASVLSDAQAIQKGGGSGSIIGRNMFQRPREESLELFEQIVDVYTN